MLNIAILLLLTLSCASSRAESRTRRGVVRVIHASSLLDDFV